MFFEVLLSIAAGCFFGIITGLTPGVHVNLVSVLLVSISGYLLGFLSPLSLGVFIVAMGITHTFLDAVPSIFLGAPDPDMALAVLPGHRLLLEGRGYEAVKLTVIGSLLGLIGTVILIPFIIPFLPLIYSYIEPWMGWILIVVVVYMVLKEGKFKKIFGASFVFLLSGVLGIIVLGWPNLEQPLFPMLSGLFGISTLLLSLKDKVEIPKQYVTEGIKVKLGSNVKAVSGAVVTGSLAGLMPGLGSAQSAIIAMQFLGNIGNYAFLILVGGINTVNFTFSLAALYTLGKARNGAIVAVMEILKSIGLTELIVFIAAALIAGGIATFLTLYISKVFAHVITKVNYQYLCLGVITFVTAMVVYFSGLYGLFVLVTSTAVGMIPALIGVKRSMAMGCLLLPVILFFML